MKRLSEIGFIGYPDDTGMRRKFDPQIKGKEFPYNQAGLATNPLDPTGIQPDSHKGLTPKDTSHSVWDDAVREAGGFPVSFAKSSPGGMAGVIPGGRSMAGNPFDKPIDYDELEKAGKGTPLENRIARMKKRLTDPRKGYYDGHEKSFDSPPSDDELDKTLGGAEHFPGSPFPSDIMIFGNDPFSQGLGMPTQNHRDLFGIMDSAGELPKKSVWSYLEQTIIRGILGK